MVTDLKDKDIDERILTILSMNGRAPLDLIGKKVGLTKHPIFRRIKKLEKEYGIRYKIEVDVEKLGYVRFFILIKFLDKIPNNEEITDAIKQEARIQFGAVLTGGNYNLILYALAEDNLKMELLRSNLMRKTILSRYPLELYITPFYEYQGFIPLRPEFIENLRNRLTPAKEDILFEEKRQPTEKKKQTLFREFAVLKELTDSGDTPFLDIDKKYGFDKGRSQYSYYKLKKDGIIKRTTISMKALQIKYIAILFLRVFYTEKFYKHRKPLLQSLIKPSKNVSNRYVLAGDIGAPFGALFALPVFEDGELDKTLKSLSIIGSDLKVGIVTKILVGELCFRRFDNTYTLQYSLLNKEFGQHVSNKLEEYEKSTESKAVSQI